MKIDRLSNPEESWKEIIEEAGDEHSPLGPKLSNAFRNSPYLLMWYVGWFKFAAKMVGSRGKTLVFEQLEGLGAWTIANETKDVIAILPTDDSFEEVSSAWPDRGVFWEKRDFAEVCSENKFSGIVCFDVEQKKSKEDWVVFFKDASQIIADGGVVVVGGFGEGLSIVLKEAATAHFAHIFMFGDGQIHPCVSPSNASIVVAC